MLLSAVQKTTLLDYPGKVATIVFTLGCNLRCRYCHNPEFVLPHEVEKIRPHVIPEAVFFRFLESRKGFLDGVVICGGEPTIQSGLLEFCERIHTMGFLVKLDTNGARPDVLARLLDAGVLDYIAMDVKHAPGKYQNLVGGSNDELRYQESIDLILSRAPDYEFRTTVVRGIHSEVDIHAIGERIRGAKRFSLQNFRSGKTLEEDFSGESFSSEELANFHRILERYVGKVYTRTENETS